MTPPDDVARSRRPLDVDALRHAALSVGWRRLNVVEETGSTNADLLARAAAGEDVGGSVLLAETQTAGRGRNGRTWSTTPYAAVTVSVGVDATSVPAGAWGWLPLAAGIAVVDAVYEVAGVRAGLKWPNDVLADGGLPSEGGHVRKLAGILAEVASPAQVVVVGIGLNVTLQGEEIAEPVAASMAALGAATLDRTALAGRLLGELGFRIGQWRDGAGTALADDYRRRSTTIGSYVRAVLPGDREILGDAVDVDDDGRLLIATAEGTATLSAGDVKHLRRP